MTEEQKESLDNHEKNVNPDVNLPTAATAEICDTCGHIETVIWPQQPFRDRAAPCWNDEDVESKLIKQDLVRRQDVEQLFKPEQHARRLEDLSRRLQAAASNPFDKEEVLTVAKELSDLSDERAEFLEEVQKK